MSCVGVGTWKTKDLWFESAEMRAGETGGKSRCLFSFSLCGAALASSLFMRLPPSVKSSNRSLLLVVGGSGTQTPLKHR